MLHWEILRWAGLSIPIAWALWLLLWLITSLRTKRTLRQESAATRLAYLLPIIASIILFSVAGRSRLGQALDAIGPPVSWLFARFIPFYLGVVWIGAPLVLVGLLFAAWARFHLAGNWSGTVTLKEDHELIRTGPYRFVRHPIYTGILVAVAGSACAIGQWRGLLAFALTLCGLLYKSRVEERLMVATFGDAYRRYRAEVKRLIPFVL